MKKLISIILIICFLASCTLNQTVEPIILNESEATVEGVAAVVVANNQFAFELFSQIDNEDNIFFSPYSISTALAMTYEGARGSTAEEMQAVFHFPDELRQNNALIYNNLNAVQDEYKLNTANALWTSQDYVFLPEYLTTVETYYGGKAQSVDFNDAEKASEIINTWVEQQTNNKIKDLISSDNINSETKLILTNAIYFKGKWEYPFKESNTKDKEFTTFTGESVQVPMMYAEKYYKYAETDDVQVLEIPYEGDTISMIIILPKENFDSLNLSTETIDEYTRMLNHEEVIVYLPRFTFKTKYSLNSHLIELGMPAAFSSTKADFSGMTSSNDLYIGFVIHQAFIEVNEEGTEAAAATAVGVETTSLGPEETEPYMFNANHPFVFIIKDNETGTILFIGKVNNPLE
ncbi:MAG: serpin family protein [Candidatus Woesearchaeota archaeon]|jgi:serpin B